MEQTISKQKSNKTKPGLRDYWQIIQRRKWVIILPGILICLVAIPGSFLITPKYQAFTTLISQEVERGSVLQRVANIPVPRSEAMNTVRHKIESYKYMKDAANKVNIANYLASIGKPSELDDVVRYLRDLMSLKPQGTRIIEVSVKHEIPEMARDITNAIASTYVEKTLLWRQQATIESAEFINKELAIFRDRLRKAEEALVDAQEQSIFDSLSSEDSSLVSELAKLRSNLVEVELDLREASSELQNAKDVVTGNATEGYSPAFYTDPEIAALQTKLVSLKTRYAEVSIKYTDQYPEAKALSREIILAEEDLDKAKSKFSTDQKDVTARIQYWEDRIRTLKVKQTALNDKIAEYNRNLQQLPQHQLELARLRREKEAAEETYSMLLARLNESELLRSSELQNMGRVAEILDPAILPDTPVSPNKKKITILAIAMGLMIGSGLTFMLEYFDRSFRSVDEVVEHFGLPVLATIPKLATHDLKIKAKRRKLIYIICIALVSLLILAIVADVVGMKFLGHGSFFLRGILGILNRAAT